MGQENSLTAGNVTGALVRFSVPLFLSNLLQSVYGIVDMAVVGHFVGSAGLAATGSAAMLGLLILSVSTGIATGGAVLIARYEGAGDAERRDAAAGALFSLSFLAAALVTALGLAAYPAVFRWMEVPPQALPYAIGYMKVTLWGAVFVFGYNAVCAALRGLGDSRRPLFYVGVASALNVILDVALVGAMGLGTSGAAAATVAAQGISFLLAAGRLLGGKTPVRLTAQSFRLRKEICVGLLAVGIPTAAQQAVLNLSYLFVTGMLNSYGVTVAAAAGIGLKVNTFAAMPCWAVGQAITVMTGQNLGAGDLERARRTARSGAAVSAAASILTMLLVQALAGQIVGLFDPNPETIREGVRYLRICCSLNCVVYAVMYSIDSFATGAGDAVFSMANSFLHSVGMRLALSILLEAGMGLGFVGIYWGECLSPVPSFLAGLWYYNSGRWKRKAPGGAN